jgi:TusA-related sulfurtransferase
MNFDENGSSKTHLVPVNSNFTARILAIEVGQICKISVSEVRLINLKIAVAQISKSRDRVFAVHTIGEFHEVTRYADIPKKEKKPPETHRISALLMTLPFAEPTEIQGEPATIRAIAYRLSKGDKPDVFSCFLTDRPDALRVVRYRRDDDVLVRAKSPVAGMSPGDTLVIHLPRASAIRSLRSVATYWARKTGRTYSVNDNGDNTATVTVTEAPTQPVSATVAPTQPEPPLLTSYPFAIMAPGDVIRISADHARSVRQVRRAAEDASPYRMKFGQNSDGSFWVQRARTASAGAAK